MDGFRSDDAWVQGAPAPAYRGIEPTALRKVNRTDSFYDPPSASHTYDRLFTGSYPVPGLDGYVPQGTATWSNWQGDDDLILVTAYKDDHSAARIHALDAKTGKHIGSVDILGFDGNKEYSHVGGIAVFEHKNNGKGWAFISAKGDGNVRKYSLSKLKTAIKATTPSQETIKPDGQQTIAANSFLTSHAPSNTLWAGNFKITSRSSMYSYTVADNGDLTRRAGSWQVPKKTQGLVVTNDVFIYSASYDRNDRSNLYVVRRGEGSSNLDTAKVSCFRAPSMSEGLTVYGNSVFLAYESGASHYRNSSNKPLNIIPNLHRTTKSWLEALPPR